MNLVKLFSKGGTSVNLSGWIDHCCSQLVGSLFYCIHLADAKPATRDAHNYVRF